VNVMAFHMLAFTHHLHVIINLPHSALFFKCYSLDRPNGIYLFTHCLQVPHF
jgi:hypothetical protein